MAKKIPNVSKWGVATAKERYGSNEPTTMPPVKNEQPPQDPQDKHGAGYDNDASGWVRGHGSPYPYFDKHKAGR